MRVCVYTAIYGGYDELTPPAAQTVDCDFICFTDQAGPARENGWRMIHARRPIGHPRMHAKFFKLMSHRVFPNGRLALRYNGLSALTGCGRRYDALVWVDGCVRINSPRFAEEFVAHIGATGWAMFKHPDRDCIYDELKASLPMAKYREMPLREQVEAYRREGYPAHHGLMACTAIARKPADHRLVGINEAWWQENFDWTYQDQISLPVVLWRLGLSYDAVERNLWDNSWFERQEHRSDL